MFNLKKAEKLQHTKSYPQQLAEKRKEFNQKEPDEGTTERQLEANSHKTTENATSEQQLKSVRTGTEPEVTEKQLNTAKKLYNDKRDDSVFEKKLTAPNLVSEAYHQENLKEFKKGREKNRDTAFWDDFVGSQMIGEKTKIVSNNQYSQLQNKEDRFTGLKTDNPTTKKIEEMVVASLNNADKMQFQIFANAASEKRELNKSELQQITDINSGKARLLAKYEGAMDKLKKNAQNFYDEEPTPLNDFEQDDLATYNQNEADDYRNEGADLGDGDLGMDSTEEKFFTVEPSQTGYTLYLHEREPEESGSVRAGLMNKKFIDSFATPEEAHQAAEQQFPGVEFREGVSQADEMPANPPEWFDPNAAGEVWREDEY